MTSVENKNAGRKFGPNDYFDFVFKRFAFALGEYWLLIPFEDGTVWKRIGAGVYWRIKP